jgi:hypothetical protein
MKSASMQLDHELEEASMQLDHELKKSQHAAR